MSCKTEFTTIAEHAVRVSDVARDFFFLIIDYPTSRIFRAGYYGHALVPC